MVGAIEKAEIAGSATGHVLLKKGMFSWGGHQNSKFRASEPWEI